jgi:hypothetical protein
MKAAVTPNGGGALMTDSLEDRDIKAVARNRPSSDHPIWTEPCPRRVRALLEGVAVVDSTRTLLLLEAKHLAAGRRRNTPPRPEGEASRPGRRAGSSWPVSRHVAAFPGRRWAP